MIRVTLKQLQGQLLPFNRLFKLHHEMMILPQRTADGPAGIFPGIPVDGRISSELTLVVCRGSIGKDRFGLARSEFDLIDDEIPFPPRTFTSQLIISQSLDLNRGNLLQLPGANDGVVVGLPFLATCRNRSVRPRLQSRARACCHFPGLQDLPLR